MRILHTGYTFTEFVSVFYYRIFLRIFGKFFENFFENFWRFFWEFFENFWKIFLRIFLRIFGRFFWDFFWDFWEIFVFFFLRISLRFFFENFFENFWEIFFEIFFWEFLGECLFLILYRRRYNDHGWGRLFVLCGPFWWFLSVEGRECLHGWNRGNHQQSVELRGCSRVRGGNSRLRRPHLLCLCAQWLLTAFNVKDTFFHLIKNISWRINSFICTLIF